MNDEQKQIEEMAKAMCEEYDTDICKHECPMATDCANILIAKRLIAAGYRKQSDTVKEFVCKVLQIGSKRPLCLFNEYKEGYTDCLDQIKELAAQYGVGGGRMKYERLTKETVGSFGYDLKDFEHKPKEFNDYDAFYAYKMAVKRLGELEDKIEAGTFVEVPKGAVVLTPEERDEEMRLRNEERKQAVKEFVDKVRDKEFSVNMGAEWFAVVRSRDIDEIVNEVCKQ